ncbi:MAG TPA: phenylalanine--tRNA ligase subunit beta [Rhizomicrobium sp.]|jgi:phenylalanyl-tRNA synthetase beta chain|nr:phenylalanine--tRNA ligase subunit beta [Rhizomicrobium sp.]
MKFTLSWLKEHLETDADTRTIAETLTRIGLEVESVEDKAAALSDFIVAHVVSAEKHPNADKLKLCMVDTGSGIVQVVCGAPNAHTGMKGVFARPGTVIPQSGETLKISSIRGVESRGMLCSERELLISEEHDGIIELDAAAEIGTPAARALGLDDPVIDVAITPNRGDCTSVAGIARDLAAAGLGRLKTLSVAPVKGMFPSPVQISLNFPPGAENACPMFAGRLIRNVTNRPSPAWLQARLRAVGLRPISALVDVTNFIALDRGRPLHVFDADKLRGNMQARFARDGEIVTALDGRAYTLGADMIVIADDERALSIAGIMGGEESGCTEATTNVLVESAWFDPQRIAATGRKLGIQSDARYRFERGTDPAFVVPGLELATKLILEFCGGEPAETVVAGKPPIVTHEISFSPRPVRRLAGIDLPAAEIRAILTSLGFAVDGSDEMRVTPPSWRGDIAGPADLVEEVVRIHGIDKVPAIPMPRPHAVARAVLTPAQKRTRLARRAFAARGFSEAITYSFIPRTHAVLFGGGDDARQVENPIAADMDALRPSVLPSLLAAAQRNVARGSSELMLFEIGVQFETGMPGEQKTVAAGIRAGAAPRGWTKDAHAADAFDVKADMLAVLEAAMGAAMTAPVKSGAPGWYHPGRSGTLALGPKTLAHFGELHPAILQAFDLKAPASAFEVYLDAIPEPKTRGAARPAFQPSQFPAVERDFAFVLDSKVPGEDAVRAARNTDRLLIERVDVFDVYEGTGIPEGKKSLAIAVRLQPRARTLTDAEIEAVAEKIVAAVTKATGGALRM